MGKIISFGKSNNYYKYIFLSIFFKMINEGLYGFNYNESFNEVKIISSDKQKLFSKHRLVHQMVNYMGTLLISFLCDKYSSRQQKIKGKNKLLSDEEKIYHSSYIILIHNTNEEDVDNFLTIDLSKSVIIITFFWVFESHLLELFILCLKDLDFWMLELLIITYLSANIFKLQIYKHQKLAIYLIFFPCLLKIGTIVISFYEDGTNNLYEETVWLIPVGIAIYIILISIRSYVYTKIKWFMDLKYISSTQLLIFYGILGTIMCLIACGITTFFKCKSYEENNDRNKDIYDYICLVQENITDSNSNNNKTKIYFDSFKLYFKTFSNDIELLKEISIIILGFITFFFSAYFIIQVIKYLTPVYLIFSNPIYFFIQKSILGLYNFIKDGELFKDQKEKNYKIAKFHLDLSGDIFSIIALLIYLEVVELNFNGYNYNLRKNIIQRSLIETGQIDNIVNQQEEEFDEDTELASRK